MRERGAGNQDIKRRKGLFLVLIQKGVLFTMSSASAPLPLGPPMIHNNVGHPSAQDFSRGIVLPPISTIGSIAPNLPPPSLPSFPPPFISYPLNQAPDPTRIPLPATLDRDLHHGPTIASAVGYEPANKVGGSRHRATPSNSKALGKRKVINVSDIDSIDSGDESEVLKVKGSHGGRRQGAGNYKDDDLNELLRLVEEELPIGGNGWKRISVRYEQWATRKGRPVRNVKALESKFKGVRLLFLMYSNSNIPYCSS